MMKMRLFSLFLIFGLAAPLQAELQKRAVEYEHDGVTLEGHLVWDDAIEGKRPGVLVVHEWWGLNDYARDRAEQLAEMGYVGFAIDMYGKGKLTEHPQTAREWATEVRSNQQAWLERADAGLNVLLQHELVDAERVAAIGYCFGGSTVLQMALNGRDLAGVVSFHGSLPTTSAEQARQTKGAILVCHGAADGFIPDEAIRNFQAALEEAEVDWQMISYGGARHSFTDPAADDHGIDGIQYNERADRRSWQDMQQFFDEIFAE